jgi:hypothetical protein
MKNKFTLTLGFILLFSISCSEEDLEVKNAAPQQDQYFRESTLSYQEAVFGIYQKLLFFYNYRGLNYLQKIALFPDDDLTANQFMPFEIFSPINAGNGDVTNYYRFGYQLINRANVVIKNIQDNGDAVFGTQTTLKNTFEGEARFLRAYMYFRLQDYYGTPPLVTEQVTDINFQPANSQPGEVLDFAIQEFERAAGLLPNSWNAQNKGRVTKGSALGMLGKALLVRASNNNYSPGDLNKAIAAFDDVAALGFQLVPNFKDNFAGREKQNNAESLFEVQFGQNEFNNVWLDNDAFPFVGDLGGYWGFFENHYSMFGQPITIPTQSLQSVFEEGDPRKDATFRDGQIKKYIDGLVRGNSDVSYLNNARVLRYADVLLMKAECKLFTGDSRGAIQLLNEVRARARGSVDPPSPIPAALDENETNVDTIFKWVQDERRRELAAEEGWRWVDLKRWHRAGKINLATWDFSSNAPDFGFNVNTHLLLPFPAFEIQISNGRLQQNSGY